MRARIARGRAPDALDPAGGSTWPDVDLEYDRAVARLADSEEPAAALEPLTPARRTLVALLYVGAVIDNGGFAALFYNPSGAWWGTALAAADAVGASEHAELLRRAGALCPDGELPQDHDERNAILDGLSDEQVAVLEALDDEWDARRELLHERLRDHLRRHAGEFGRGRRG